MAALIKRSVGCLKRYLNTFDYLGMELCFHMLSKPQCEDRTYKCEHWTSGVFGGLLVIGSIKSCQLKRAGGRAGLLLLINSAGKL